MIYFVQAIDENGPIKIGTTGQLTGRLTCLAADKMAQDKPLRLLAVMDGDRSFERLLHSRFSHLRIEGEWFRAADDLFEFIRREGREWDGLNDGPESNLLVTYKASPQTFDAYKLWLDELAGHVGAPVAITIDMALKGLAEKHKFRPPPKRLGR